MTLPDLARKIKSKPDITRGVFLSGMFTAILVLGYSTGRILELEGERRDALKLLDTRGGFGRDVKIPNGELTGAASSALSSERSFVASKNGSVYHFPWCPGAKRIKDSNKVWFASREEAEAKGLRPAANCEGL
jgi:hypothetical protein